MDEMIMHALVCVCDVVCVDRVGICSVGTQMDGWMMIMHVG